MADLAELQRQQQAIADRIQSINLGYDPVIGDRNLPGNVRQARIANLQKDYYSLRYQIQEVQTRQQVEQGRITEQQRATFLEGAAGNVAASTRQSPRGAGFSSSLDSSAGTASGRNTQTGETARQRKDRLREEANQQTYGGPTPQENARTSQELRSRGVEQPSVQLGYSEQFRAKGQQTKGLAQRSRLPDSIAQAAYDVERSRLKQTSQFQEEQKQSLPREQRPKERVEHLLSNLRAQKEGTTYEFASQVLAKKYYDTLYRRDFGADVLPTGYRREINKFQRQSFMQGLITEDLNIRSAYNIPYEQNEYGQNEYGKNGGIVFGRQVPLFGEDSHKVPGFVSDEEYKNLSVFGKVKLGASRFGLFVRESPEELGLPLAVGIAAAPFVPAAAVPFVFGVPTGVQVLMGAEQVYRSPQKIATATEQLIPIATQAAVFGVARLGKFGYEKYTRLRLPAEERVVFDIAPKLSKQTKGVRSSLEEPIRFEELKYAKPIEPEIRQTFKEYPDAVVYGSGTYTGQVPKRVLLPERITVEQGRPSLQGQTILRNRLGSPEGQYRVLRGELKDLDIFLRTQKQAEAFTAKAAELTKSKGYKLAEDNPTLLEAPGRGAHALDVHTLEKGPGYEPEPYNPIDSPYAEGKLDLYSKEGVKQVRLYQQGTAKLRSMTQVRNLPPETTLQRFFPRKQIGPEPHRVAKDVSDALDTQFQLLESAKARNAARSRFNPKKYYQDFKLSRQEKQFKLLEESEFVRKALQQPSPDAQTLLRIRNEDVAQFQREVSQEPSTFEIYDTRARRGLVFSLQSERASTTQTRQAEPELLLSRRSTARIRRESPVQFANPDIISSPSAVRMLRASLLRTAPSESGSPSTRSQPRLRSPPSSPIPSQPSRASPPSAPPRSPGPRSPPLRSPPSRSPPSRAPPSRPPITPDLFPPNPPRRSLRLRERDEGRPREERFSLQLKQPKKYRPTLYAAVLNIRGAGKTRKKGLSGLEVRPI